MSRRGILKWIIYAFLTVLGLLSEEFIFSRIRLFGAVPVAGGALVAVIAMFEGGLPGAVYGAVIGYMRYGISGGAEGLAAAAYLAGGFFIGVICAYMFRRGFITAVIWSFVLTAAATVFYYVTVMLVIKRIDAGFFFTVALPEIIYSQIFVPIIYFPARELERRLNSFDEA